MNAAHERLDSKIARSSAWGVLGFGGAQVVAFLTTVALARLLQPEDFGLMAITVAILAIVHIAQESGLAAALIVARGDVRAAAASVAVASPLIATGLFVAMYVVAPWLADVFDEPSLTSVLRVTSLVLVVRGFTIAPGSLLQRDLLFGRITALELGGAVMQSITAIALASAGAGVWSLVGGHLALAFTVLVLAWILTPTRPSPLEARWAELRKLLRFGRYVGAANTINYAHSGAEELLVGRVLGATALGYFSLAKRLAVMPVQVIGNILGRGVFAALARLRDDAGPFKRVWLDNLERNALLSVPATIGLVVVAEPLVLILLGEKWRPIVGPLQILALGGIVRAFSTTCGEVFQAAGHPQYRLYSEISQLLLIIPSLIAASYYAGINGAAVAVVLVHAVVGIATMMGAMRVVGVGAREFAHVIARPALAWLTMVTALLLIGHLLDQEEASTQLLGLVSCGTAVYACTIVLVARKPIIKIWQDLRGLNV